MKNNEDFRKEEWDKTSHIAKTLQKIRESKSKDFIKNIANKMLNSFVLFLLRKNFFKLTPQHNIDEYGIPADSDYGDEPVCFAPIDGKITLFRYWPLVDDIKISLDQQGEKKLKTIFDSLLKFHERIEKETRN